MAQEPFQDRPNGPPLARNGCAGEGSADRLVVVATGRLVGDDHDAGHRPGSVTLSAKEIDILNSLLRHFDRPTLARRNRHFPLA
jgi:hypothetical protein